MYRRNWRELIRPRRLDIDDSSLTDSYGRFACEPLERGFGMTLGNALRLHTHDVGLLTQHRGIVEQPGVDLDARRSDDVEHDWLILRHQVVGQFLVTIVERLDRVEITRRDGY